MTTIAITDDHHMFLEAIAKIIEGFGEYKVICRAGNGRELMEQVKKKGAPDIAILDLSMPVMDGFATSKWLHEHYPATKILILTSHNSDALLVPLVREGICGFLRKEMRPPDLRAALDEVRERGFYLGGDTGTRMFTLIRQNVTKSDDDHLPRLSDKELEFIRLCTTDLTYKEIAGRLQLSPRSIDGMRDGVFEKLEVKSRVTLTVFAMRNGLIS